MVFYLFLDRLRSADRPFLILALVVLVNPSGNRAVLAVKFLAGLAVVPDVFEIEFGPAGFAFQSLACLHDQLLRLRGCGQIEGRVAPRILHVYVYAPRQV